MNYILSLFLFFLSFSLFAQNYDASKLAPRLQQLVDSEPDTKHLVYVLLSDKVDVDALDDDLYQRKATLQERTKTVITALQNKASATQPAFIQQLINQYNIDPNSIQPYWVSNAIFFEGNKSAITAISNRDDIYWMDVNAPNEVEVHEDVECNLPAIPDGVEPGLVAIGAPALWAMGYTGYGKVVFGADTGIDQFHPAIKYKYRNYYRPASESWIRFNGNGSVSNDTLPFNCGDHGNHTLGTVLGLDRNTNDTIGVAFGSLWIGTSNLCAGGTVTNIAAFQWALNPDDDINTTDDMPAAINNSWWDPGIGGNQCTGIYVDVVTALEAAGIANIFSAGNEGSEGAFTITAPKNINTDTFNIFCVAAVNGSSTNLPLAGFSSRGPSVCGGLGSLEIKPEVAAPGVSVRSCELDGNYGAKSGTSMAAPHVAGAVLLLREAFPEITGKDALRALYHTCTDLGDVGEDNEYGMGFINVLAAFNFLVDQGLEPVSPHVENDVLVVDLQADKVFCGIGEAAQITFENAGTDTLTNLTIYCGVYYEGVEVATFSTEWTGSLLNKGRTTVGLNLPTLASGNYRLLCTLKDPNGEADMKPLNNKAIESFKVTIITPYTLSILGMDSVVTCEDASAVLFCDYSEPATIGWYNTSNDGVLLGEGNYFVTPELGFPWTYYAEVTPSVYAGKETIDMEQSDIGGNEGRLIFDVDESFILKSVTVFADVAGARIFELKNSDETWSIDRLVTLEAGEQRVVLDMEIPVENNLQFGIVAGQNVRYSTEANYPYDLGGYGEIERSNFPSSPFGIYYGFYNWEVQALAPCDRVPIDVDVVPADDVPDAVFSSSATTVELSDGLITFTDESVNATSWNWDFGDGNTSTDASPSHMYTAVGSYPVILTVVGPQGCSDVSLVWIEVLEDPIVSTTYLNELEGEVLIFPNPVADQLQISFDLNTSQQLQIEVRDAIGRNLIRIPTKSYFKDQLKLDMSDLSSGLYYVTLKSENGLMAFKVVRL